MEGIAESEPLTTSASLGVQNAANRLVPERTTLVVVARNPGTHIVNIPSRLHPACFSLFSRVLEHLCLKPCQRWAQ